MFSPMKSTNSSDEISPRPLNLVICTAVFSSLTAASFSSGE